MVRCTIIIKIGCDPEAAENMIRLDKPGFTAAGPYPQPESAVKYITRGETGSQPVRTDHHAAKIKL
jgi:hypothetical protein